MVYPSLSVMRSALGPALAMVCGSPSRRGLVSCSQTPSCLHFRVDDSSKKSGGAEEEWLWETRRGHGVETEHGEGRLWTLEGCAYILLGATLCLHLAALSSWWVCCVHVSRDCVTSVRSYSDPPLQLGKGSE